jgi:2-methylisocitrate lyase-like PEP mutase family enzyme
MLHRERRRSSPLYEEFKRLGVDAVFVEALPDAEAMKRCAEEIDIPIFGTQTAHS